MLGQLLVYCTKHQDKLEIAPNAAPGIMMGWKLEFGFRCKGVLVVADYDALREKKVTMASVPDREVYEG